MAKTRDYPSDVRDFIKIINSFHGGYRDHEIFIDFIDYIIACLLINGDKDVAERLKEKYKKDYIRFNDMIICFFTTMKKQLDTHKWYDMIGRIYEEMAHNSTKSALGQFFTPPEICDMMAQVVIDKDQEKFDLNEPACGSGRNILAANAVNHRGYYVAMDLDSICVKMCAINLAVHGIKGRVIQGDTLRYVFNYGYEVNRYQYSMCGIPHITYFKIEMPERPAAKEIEIPNQKTGSQLNLF